MIFKVKTIQNQLYVSADYHPEQAQCSALTDDRVDELIVAQGQYQIGDIFKEQLKMFSHGIDAAFIDVGESDKNGFVHISDLGPLRLKEYLE